MTFVKREKYFIMGMLLHIYTDGNGLDGISRSFFCAAAAMKRREILYTLATSSLSSSVATGKCVRVFDQVSYSVSQSSYELLCSDGKSLYIYTTHIRPKILFSLSLTLVLDNFRVNLTK